MSKNTLGLLALCSLLWSQLASAVVVDGVVFLNSTDHVEDRDELNNEITRSVITDWSNGFSFSSVEGRTASIGSFGFESSTTGLQFDVFQHTGVIDSTGVPYLSGTGSSDRASAQLQLTFSLTESTAYAVSGDFFGSGEASNFGGGTFAAITDLATNTNVFLERAFTSPTDDFGYSFGDAAPEIGQAVGLLGPGDYRLVWESQTVDALAIGGGLMATSVSDFQFQLGEFTAVPAPAGALLLLPGLLLLASRRLR